MALGSTYLLALCLLVALFIQPGETTVDVWEGKNAECYEAQKLVDEVVYVKNTDMARNAVQRALDDDLPICVKSGGHSYTCNFAKPGCFQIDMSKMNSVDISEEGEGDAKRYFATMGPGALTRGPTSFTLLESAPWLTCADLC
jgi:FAD/FMN-containing dehydrogenase